MQISAIYHINNDSSPNRASCADRGGCVTLTCPRTHLPAIPTCCTPIPPNKYPRSIQNARRIMLDFWCLHTRARTTPWPCTPSSARPAVVTATVPQDSVLYRPAPLRLGVCPKCTTSYKTSLCTWRSRGCLMTRKRTTISSSSKPTLQ